MIQIRKTLISLLLLFPFVCFAQGKQIVLLYRNDGKSPLYKSAKVFFNDSLIYKHKKNFVLIDTIKACGGTYSWGVSSIKQAHTYVKAKENTLTIIEISVKGDWLYNGLLRMRKVNIKQFRDAYCRKKWLRESLSNAGYQSIDALISKYEVN